MIYFLDFLFSLVGVLLSVAFFTLMERKIMGLSHFRKGPNMVSLYGILQPMSDALKLLNKEFIKFSFMKMTMFFLGPCVTILLMMMVWAWYNYKFSIMSSSMSVLIILTIMSLTAYGFLLTSWGSNSKYSLLGGYRAVAQVISYEVCLVLYILVVIFIMKSFSMEKISMMQENFWAMMLMLPLFFSWLTLCLAETNRTPFDMAEGESEIVSGFNIEYGGPLFALIFISEYGMIIFISFLTSMLFMGGNFLVFKTMLMCFFFVWVRCCFPRVRYDKLMMISWKILLPFSLSMMMVCGW